jgi:uncharacterized protein YciI
VFIIDLHYTQPLDKVDEYLEAHVAHLKRHLDAGDFIAVGRKKPRTGGILLANVSDRPTAEAIAAEDPFVTNNVATATVVEFEPAMAAPEFTALLAKR